MSFFWLRTLPGYAWPAVPDAAAAQLWCAYRALDRSQWLQAHEVEERQLAQVRTLLAHCVTQVPHYREVLPAAGIVPGAIRTMEDFRRLPLLPRRTYQERLDSFEARQLPAGTRAAATPQTSGSSGTPTKVFQSNMVLLWWTAFYLRDLEWCGIDPTGTLAVIRSTGRGGDKLAQLLDGVSTRSWLASLEPLIDMGTMHIMDIGQDPRRQLRWLREVAPTCLLTYPSNLEVLARLAQASGPLPSLRVIQAISETLSDEARAEIEAAFGVPVKSTYSSVEAGYLASPCPSGQGWHVHAENVLLEVLDPAGRPCEPGQSGRVYITCLQNLRGPLVRYELGDEATVGDVCPCGRGLPLLARVEGKRPPLFRLADGRQKSSTVLARLVRKIGGHWQHQVIQKAVDHVVVRLAVDATWTQTHAGQLRERLLEFFEGPLRIDIETHDALPAPPHGKFQSMVLELDT